MENLKEEYQIYVTVETMLNVNKVENFEYWKKNIFDGVFTESTGPITSYNLVY